MSPDCSLREALGKEATVKHSGRTSGKMVSTYRTNCTETEQIFRGQWSTYDELDRPSRKSERAEEEDFHLPSFG
jgi:hypothetical protein